LFGTLNTCSVLMLDVGVACMNPAEIDGSGGQLKALLPARAGSGLTASPGPWTTDNDAIETPFVMLPGLLSGKCVHGVGSHYLAVTLAADPLDRRTDTILGDMVVDGKVQPEWGLHLIDMNLALGNLVDIVKRQSDEWVRARTPAPAPLPTPAPPTPQ
jgi:hypothetical protein